MMQEIKKSYLKNAILILIFISGLLSACNKNKDAYSESRAIYNESIIIHDEVMPLLGNIMQLQKKLKEIKLSIDENSPDIDTINSSLQELEDAHNAMMNWMRNLTPIPDPSSPIQDKSNSRLISASDMVEIQTKSLERIKIVRKMILDSMTKAEKLIADL